MANYKTVTPCSTIFLRSFNTSWFLIQAQSLADERRLRV